MKKNVSVNCGWGKLLFAQTYARGQVLYADLCDEPPGTRNIVFYPEDPHVVVANYPQELFIDPSHTYRKDIKADPVTVKIPPQIIIREAVLPADREQINAVYLSQQALELPANYRLPHSLTLFVAEEEESKQIVGVCMWLNHMTAFEDPEQGSSFWALAVSSACPIPGIGLALVQQCMRTSQSAGCRFLDLSVMYSNKQAIALYDKLGFTKTPWLAVKNKSEINEKLFTQDLPETGLNVRSKVIIDGARKRGISIEVIDNKGFFNLVYGGKTVSCYESLTDMTSAIGLKRCDNHSLTNTLLHTAGLSVPAQAEYVSNAQAEQFLSRYGMVVTKVLRGIKFEGTSVDITSVTDLKYGIKKALRFGDRVLLEQSVSGQRYRVLIINYQAAALLKINEPFIVGTGKHTIRNLIMKVNRRQSTQYDDMRIPIDKELRTCLREGGYTLDFVPKENERIVLRKFASSKTGEFLEVMSLDSLNPDHIAAAEAAAVVLQTPVVGIEIKVDGDMYHIIQANERPSLAPPHDPLVVNAFLDFLFPQLAPLSDKAV